MPNALITGASEGFGRAVACELGASGWRVILTGRRAGPLQAVATGLPGAVAMPGDVTDAAHRTDVAAAVRERGNLDLLVNNASTLGPSPLPGLADYPLEDLRRVYETNVLAPLALIQAVLPALQAADGVIVNLSSDAAVEAYPGWGGYGSSKAALDQLSAVLAAEQPHVHVYAFDPGDMRTAMHQLAFPGEDISDRAAPETVAPALVRLVTSRPPSGRYRASDLG
jgi:NAD(P)-dependent dehydrogenase (short-subunit alcohol dehydrogenase family)